MADKIAKIDRNNPDPQLIKRAAELVLAGKVLVCPTDTGYAFAANALDEKAVTMVFRLKGRSFTNPIHIAVSSLEEAEKYAEVNRAARKLAWRFLPGALTLVLPRRKTVPAVLVAGKNTVGIRIPDNNVILALTEMTGLPITMTSANPSGQPTPYNVPEIVAEMKTHLSEIALVLDQGVIAPPELSTIIDLTLGLPRLLRQGHIPWAEIQEVLLQEGD